MDIIILSQTKDVIKKVNDIGLNGKTHIACFVNNGETITTLGTYKDEARCKQILMDIFKRAELAERMKGNVIFEMPEE